MGIVSKHPPVKYFIAVMFDRGIDPLVIEKEIIRVFGEIENRSERYSFSHSVYYDEEMGTDLEKYFLVFSELRSPLFLSECKLITNRIEEKFIKTNGSRKVNLDPGYISEAKIILATTKNFDHRVYVGEGVYADVQLRMHKKKYAENEWTYPDYRLAWVKDFFRENRKKYFKQLEDVPETEYE